MFFSLLKQATGPADRWLMALSAITLIAFAGVRPGGVGEEVIVHLDNQKLMVLSLKKDSSTNIDGRLGPIKIEVKSGRARLLEYKSLRLIGTRTGWIKSSGEIAVCVPCGVLIQIQGGTELPSQKPGHLSFDGIAR